MGYWKREYTARRGGVPLFKPEPKPAAEKLVVGEEFPCNEATSVAQPAAHKTDEGSASLVG